MTAPAAALTAQDIIRRLLGFRWNDRGYGQLACKSCGALASEHYDEAGSHLKRIDQCSRSCPWRQAEEFLEQDTP